MLFLMFFAEASLLAGMQLDFKLPIQLLILSVSACIAGLVFAIFVEKSIIEIGENQDDFSSKSWCG